MPRCDHRVHAGHHVLVGLVEVVPHHVAQEVVAVAGAAPIVGLEHGVAERGEHRHVVGRAPRAAELVARRGPAVRLHHEWVALSLPVVERIVEQPFDGDAVLALPGDRLLLRDTEAGGQVVEDVGDLRGTRRRAPAVHTSPGLTDVRLVKTCRSSFGL